MLDTARPWYRQPLNQRVTTLRPGEDYEIRFVEIGVSMSATVDALKLHAYRVSFRTTWIVVEIHTKEGWIGMGECSDVGPVVRVTEETEEVFRLIKDSNLCESWQDVDESLWQWSTEATNASIKFLRRTIMGGVVSAILDIVAQVAEVPLWEWLGGHWVPEIPLYANINRAPVKRVPSEFAEVALRAVRDGFSAIKLAPFDGPAIDEMDLVTTGLSHVRAVRQAAGYDVDLYVDVHAHLSREQIARVIEPLQELEVVWFEDAVDTSIVEDVKWLKSSSVMPLAGGEHIIDLDPFLELRDSGLLDIMLIDPKHVGGPLRVIEFLRGSSGVDLTYHNPTGPVATALATHLFTLHRDCSVLEIAYGEDVRRAEFLNPGETMQEGSLELSTLPGLGVQLSTTSRMPQSATVSYGHA